MNTKEWRLKIGSRTFFSSIHWDSITNRPLYLVYDGLVQCLVFMEVSFIMRGRTNRTIKSRFPEIQKFIIVLSFIPRKKRNKE